MDEQQQQQQQQRDPIIFVKDEDGVMAFTRCRRGQFRGDWISVGSAGMSIHFAIVQDANQNCRHIHCASMNDRLSYRLVASGYCSLKDARRWCGNNAHILTDTFAFGGSFHVATIESSHWSTQKPKAIKTSDEIDIEKMERDVKKLEVQIEKLQAQQANNAFREANK